MLWKSIQQSHVTLMYSYLLFLRLSKTILNGLICYILIFSVAIKNNLACIIFQLAFINVLYMFSVYF